MLFIVVHQGRDPIHVGWYMSMEFIYDVIHREDSTTMNDPHLAISDVT